MTTITTLPPAPSRADPANFAAKGDALLGALDQFVSETNTVAGEVNTNATTATAQAGNASTSASAASASASSASTSASTATTKASEAAASAASAASAAAGFVATSTTSLLIAVASKTFTIQTGKQYTAGVWVIASSNANPANFMFGQVISYAGTTLIVDVQVIGGSGTLADWNISLAGARGATGLGITPQATGFTATAGTTPKTLIVDDDLTASQAARRNAANIFTAAQELSTGTAISSAATINLDTATGNRVHITGTATITAVTLTRGPRTVIFDGILTLTHHATNNNLPGAANITTAAGDRAIYESDGTTVYCTSYIKASGLPVVPGSSGALVYLSTVTASGAATVDIETGFSATYDDYVIVFNASTASGTPNMLLTMKIGGAYLTAGYDGIQQYTSNAAPTFTGQASTNAASAIAGVLTTTGGAGTIDIFDVNSASVKSVLYRSNFANGTTANYFVVAGVSNRTGGVLSGIRLTPSASTITGTFKLYGIAKA